ncbi:hypothetical protein PC121_g12271 [Phytophthora cactorum]|nr:hypothetical protein PC120_g16986 [Phytophthora cactorum]KAG3063231.1 hypothetical protein PC121_g12271 [Phytophthora cactorum]KAG4047524.1 hypothetical protein PC123_g17129 [Phytophthora cactorum]
MEGGGRGGGRGKGKKSKAAKKKAAAAASAQAVSTHKKAAIGAKKVAASHPTGNVQVVSAAPEPATASHEQPMTKSKRKRLKKQAAAEALKAAQPAKKSPTAAAASPKTKVVVLTPPATAVKPHVVSLTGGKNKKRKLSAVADSSGEVVASTAIGASPKGGQVVESSKLLATTKKKKKNIAVLGHAGASPTPSTKTPLSAANPNKRAQIQNVYKKESVTTTAAASTTASPRKTVKKLKAIAAATASPVSTAVSPKDECLVGVKKLEGKADIKQPEVVVTVTKTSASPKVTMPEKVTQQRKITQAGDSVKKSPVQQLRADQVQTKEISPKKAEVVTTLAKRSPPDTAAVVSAGASDTMPPPKPNIAVMAPIISSKTAHTTTPIAATGTASVVSRSVLVSATSASPPHVTTTKPAPSPLVTTVKSSDHALSSSGGLKRRRSIDQVSANSVADPLQPPAKRNAGASKVDAVQPKTVQQTGSSDARLFGAEQKTTQRIQHTECITKRTDPADTPISIKESHVSVKTDAVIAAPSVKALSTSSTLSPESATQHLRATQLAGKVSKNLSPECKTPPEEIQVATSKVARPIAKQAERKVKVTSTTSPKKEAGFDSTTKTSSESAAKTKKVGIIMDSPAYVEKMMRGELKPREFDPRPAQPTVTLPQRPQNAWGASFGMVPSAERVTPAPRTLSTTPLSSWFLSKGCANFVKQVHFSDDDADNSREDDNGDVTRQLATPRGVDNALRASSTKKNDFLESLTTQSNWRTWYGNVDVHNLLDPPLAHVPENVRIHEVRPLALPEPTTEIQASSPMKKTSELEMLEADIRREKQRGSAFSQQLLMMLQGNTVSGKLLEEEYKPILHQ